MFLGIFFIYMQCTCVVWVISMSLQIDMARGIVLEETYQKWIQYKDECIHMIHNQPLLLGISFPLILIA